MVLNAWYDKLLYIVIDSNYHRGLLCLCYYVIVLLLLLVSQNISNREDICLQTLFLLKMLGV